LRADDLAICKPAWIDRPVPLLQAGDALGTSQAPERKGVQRPQWVSQKPPRVFRQPVVNLPGGNAGTSYRISNILSLKLITARPNANVIIQSQLMQDQTKDATRVYHFYPEYAPYSPRCVSIPTPSIRSTSAGQILAHATCIARSSDDRTVRDTDRFI
jgi:hypothetical protein